MSHTGTGTPASTPSASTTVASISDAPFLLERVTLPSAEPVTLAEIRRHVREFDDVTDNDADLTDLIQGGREWAEDYTGRALMTQTWRITINRFASNGAIMGMADVVAGNWPQFSAVGWQKWQQRNEIFLLKSPVTGITKFVSCDSAGTETTIASTQYAFTEPASKWPRIVPLSGASFGTGAIKVEFTAGYASAALVPNVYKQAIKLWVEAHYDRDKDMMPILLEAAMNLLKPFRCELNLA